MLLVAKRDEHRRIGVCPNSRVTVSDGGFGTKCAAAMRVDQS
jgi:hypothetical protein